MSIRIIAKGNRLYKLTEGNDGNGPFSFETEILGKEKAFYAKELLAIDKGIGDGHRIGNIHRDYCECEECVKGEQVKGECITCNGVGWLDGHPDPCVACAGTGCNRS